MAQFPYLRPRGPRGGGPSGRHPAQLGAGPLHHRPRRRVRGQAQGPGTALHRAALLNRQQQLEAFVAQAGQPAAGLRPGAPARGAGEDSPLWRDEAHSPEPPDAQEALRLRHRINFHVSGCSGCWTSSRGRPARGPPGGDGHRCGARFLAVGVHKHGADAWALQDAMAPG
ncbi:hypothetical protein QJS66_17695 [Kocuria rhizophila]|nr:hypothetical protein QJS66_17695 [Kocuria rhizophila]